MAIKGYFNFPDFYQFAVDHLVNTFSKDIKILEVGTYFGASAYYLGSITKGMNIQVDTIDTFKGSPEHQKKGKIPSFVEATENLKDFPHVSVFVSDSLEWARETKVLEIEYNMVFLDGLHSYEQVKAEIEAYLPLIKDGGIISGHDYNNTWKGVIKAVNEAFGSGVEVMGDCWYVKL